MIKQIDSIKNPEIKQILTLQGKANIRKKLGLFYVEGVREINIALNSGYLLHKTYIQPYIFKKDYSKYPSKSIVEVSQSVYQKICYRSSTEGIFAIFKTKEHLLKNLKLKETPLILVAESPEKPGNIGAILRTTDAANLDAVIIADSKTDLYNPNVIRSSLGCVFSNQIAIDSRSNIINFLKENNIQILPAALSNKAKNYLDIDYTKPTAIIVGTESTGLTNEWLYEGKPIIIPMNGLIDSMNVSVSSAIIIFEAIRQRSLHI